MKRFILTLSILVFAGFSFCQNIPRANHTGPYGFQVNTLTGNLYIDRTDLTIPNQGIPIALTFSYNSYRDTLDDGFGKGWTFSLGMCYEVDSSGSVIIHQADGRRDRYVPSMSSYLAPQGIFDQLQRDGDLVTLTTKYGMVYRFGNAQHKKLTQILDPNGNSLSLTYSNGQPTSIVDESGRSIQLSWENGYLARVTDPNFPSGRSISYQYNSKGQLLSVTDPLANQVRYTYNSKNQLSQYTNENGYLMDIIYSEGGAVKEIRSCLEHVRFSYNQGKTFVVEEGESRQVVTYEYDQEGRLLGKKGNCCGYDVQYTYDQDNNIASVQDAKGALLITNSDRTGNVLQTEDDLGGKIRFEYSNALNRLTGITDKKGNQTSYTYDDQGNLTRIQQPEGLSFDFSYDEAGNLTRFVDAKENTLTMVYNQGDDLTEVSYPIGSESFMYDGVGNMTSGTDPNGNTTSFLYDALDRITSIQDAMNHSFFFSYDANSNLTQEIDANGNTKAYEYDAYDRLNSVTTPSGTTKYAYDNFGNLTEILDANTHSSQFRYDQRNQLVEEQDAMGFITRYGYDANGNLTRRIDANGNTTTYTYDALNRITSKTYLGNTDTYEYDPNGNLSRCSNQDISMSFTYDGLNRLVQKSYDTWNKTISYTYDEVGNRSSMTDPEGGVTQYQYDANNRLTQITTPQEEIIRFSYDVGGRMTRQDNANGTYSLYTYDLLDRVVSLSHYNSSDSVFASYSYTYDNNGNRLSMTDHEGGVNRYEYDGDNRLTQVNYPDGTIESYMFDATGNRLSLKKDGVTTEYAYDAADRLLSSNEVAYSYDNNGNLIAKVEDGSQTNYQYDGENRLTRIRLPDSSFIQYLYDPLGNRLSKRGSNINSVNYLLDGENILQEVSPPGELIVQYIAGMNLDEWLTMRRDGETYSYHSDALGSIMTITGGGGSIQNSYTYDAYGNPSISMNNVANSFFFTGREWEEENNSLFFRTRYYSPLVGRFLQKDGFEGFAYNPYSINKYNYLESNPINYTDATGEFVPVILGIGARIAAKYLTRAAVKGFATRFAYGSILGTLKQFGKYGTNFGCYDLADIAIDGLFGKKKFKDIFKLSNFIPNKILKQLVKRGKNLRTVTRRHAERSILKRNIENIKKYGPRDGKGNFKTMEQFHDAAKAIQKGNILYELEQIGKGLLKAELKGALKGEFDLQADCETDEGFQEFLEDLEEFIDSILIPIIRPIDPNEILTPAGFGPEKWVSYQDNLPYTIFFENDPEFATAAAQRVKITHRFDEDLNPFTFRLGDFGFGDYVFEVPPNLSYYSNQFDFTDSLGLVLKVLAGVDVAQNEAFWIFESVDPETGLAESLPATAGFLPVNDTSIHNGEGFVNFTIQPMVGSTTGSEIKASASIVFDDNPPILTNEDFNTIDADHPTSQLTSLQSNADSTQFQMEWEGKDVGSGLGSYILHVSTNAGPFVPTISDLKDSTYTFFGSSFNSYQFYIQSKDNVDNLERQKFTAEPSCMSIQVVELQNATDFQPNGRIQLEVEGNQGALSFSWDHDSTLNAGTATNLPPNEYRVAISDEAGCTVSTIIEIENDIAASSDKTIE